MKQRGRNEGCGRRAKLPGCAWLDAARALRLVGTPGLRATAAYPVPRSTDRRRNYRRIMLCSDRGFRAICSPSRGTGLARDMVIHVPHPAGWMDWNFCAPDVGVVAFSALSLVLPAAILFRVASAFVMHASNWPAFNVKPMSRLAMMRSSAQSSSSATSSALPSRRKGSRRTNSAAP
jgi:hypothetical protein